MNHLLCTERGGYINIQGLRRLGLYGLFKTYTCKYQVDVKKYLLTRKKSSRLIDSAFPWEFGKVCQCTSESFNRKLSSKIWSDANWAIDKMRYASSPFVHNKEFVLENPVIQKMIWQYRI